MNQQSRQNPTLFDLLGRCWQRPAPIAGVSFDRQGSSVAFAALDGTLALAPVAEAEGPESRIRVSGDLGQMRILPRARPPAPLTAVSVQEGRAPLVVAFRESGFLVGTDDGTVRRISAQGERGEDFFRLGRSVRALDHAAQSGMTALSDGDDLCVLDQKANLVGRLPAALPDTTALKFSPDGRYLAGVSGESLVILALHEELSVQRVVTLPSPAAGLHWNGQSDRIACGLEIGGLSIVDVPRGRTDTILDFPAPVRGVAWGAAGQLVASGAYRIAAWGTSGDAGSQALLTGHTGLILVEAVASHPTRNLVAAGYADGRIVVARIGGRDELFVRPFGGTVTALAWSADGRHLAIGDADGHAALVTFPPQLFK
ncbi:hypothetical protein J8I29_26160 [Labrys sp. LIt4]|uniref:WD40 repeat domain-containing protein n=1 Tax=Labrys sp. LIt4 TaxID=2821355 RepID=UPI001ADEDF49|nr:hypothetical protein [Labrys sp. LIt4]MBP0582838.1 hypothetical protein [Labrys sp. LIt4]